MNPNFSNHFKFIPNPKCNQKPPIYSNCHLGFEEKTLKSIGFVLKSIFITLNALKKPAIAAIFVGLLLLWAPQTSWAASGGVMGGDSFDSDSDSSSYYSYDDSPSYLGSDSSLRDNGGRKIESQEVETWKFWGMCTMGVVLIFVFADRCDGGALTGRTSVIKLQVGLRGSVQSLQSDLNQIAEAADTSTQKGQSNILSETTLALLCHPDNWISACSSVEIMKSLKMVEKRFNELSTEERGKLDVETLVNVKNIKRRSTKTTPATGFSSDYIVVTVLVAALGVFELPTINNDMDLKDALQTLGSVLSHKTKAVQVLWTPQDENDSLSEREVLQKYPLLRTLEDDDILYD